MPRLPWGGESESFVTDREMRITDVFLDSLPQHSCNPRKQILWFNLKYIFGTERYLRPLA